MRHVKFEGLNRNIHQKVAPTKKPVYNFSYGNQSAPKYVHTKPLIHMQSPQK